VLAQCFVCVVCLFRLSLADTRSDGPRLFLPCKAKSRLLLKLSTCMLRVLVTVRVLCDYPTCTPVRVCGVCCMMPNRWASCGSVQFQRCVLRPLEAMDSAHTTTSVQPWSFGQSCPPHVAACPTKHAALARHTTRGHGHAGLGPSCDHSGCERCASHVGIPGDGRANVGALVSSH